MTNTILAPTTERGSRPPPAPIATHSFMSEGVTPAGLATLGRTLEWGIDQRLKSTRAAMRAWVRDAVDRAARQAGATDPALHRRRQVMQKLRVGSEATADMLLLLVDEPDICHEPATLAGPGATEDWIKTGVPARIWKLRSRLMIHGLGEAIRNRSRRGYFISRADAAAIKAIWGETSGD